jgi:hypothetical protein
MGSSIFYPAASGDDGGCAGVLCLSFSVNSSSLYFCTGPAGFTRHFVRFTNVTIPVGVTILSAFVRFTASMGGDSPSGNPKNELYFYDTDDAVAPVSQAEFVAIISGSLTEASAEWSVGPWILGATADTCSLAAPLQEVIDRAGWASGNDVMLVALETLGYAWTSRYAYAYDYDGGSKKPELHVTWTTTSVINVCTWNPLDAGTDVTIDDLTMLTATHA